MNMFAKLLAVCAVFLVLLDDASGSPVYQLLDLDDEILHDDKECKDLRDDCSNIPAKGEELIKYCEVWKDDKAVQECPMTCGKCKAPFPPLDCKDERDDCSWITDNNPDADELARYCIEYRDDNAVKQCKKTCGLCGKAPSPTNLPPTKKPQPVKTPKPQPKETPNPKPTNSPVTGQITGFQKECLVAHNKLRALHLSTPPLRWSAELTLEAQRWANKLADENSFNHDKTLKDKGQGENLAWFSPANRMCNGPSDVHCVHCGEFVQDWYNEIDDYNYATATGKEPWSVYLHFTQVVWKGTTEVGMATATKHDRVVAVARYRQAGNQGSTEVFKENVQPLHP
ncbi:protein PRY2 [Exaiptasia diaphana]|uniref:Uncharacterized protein n=1 Tax=Exaiptasia diaphana TaxID=2652724 RepID=A0A913XEF7_EXADI|nr:protein PRY2 [Exaiptasia diaphana]KXJ12772.1 Golgi-associated plant pathogenesis-related protein 1 [Exaiptasia diaphana]